MSRLLTAVLIVIALIATVVSQSTLNCRTGTYRCSDNSRCINNDFICDGVFDCGNGEDESRCGRSAARNALDPTIEAERNIPTFDLEFGEVRNAA